MAEEKILWVAYTNTDLTEGRGQSVPHAACELEVTARRLAKHIGPMGSDGEVGSVKVLQHEGKLYVPYALAKVVGPSNADLQDEARRKAREAALSKAKAAGLTDDDLKVLRGAP